MMKKISAVLLLCFVSCSLTAWAQPQEKEESKKMARAALKQLRVAFEKENLSDFLDGVSPQYLPQQIPELKQNLIKRFDTVDQIYVKIIVGSYVINMEKHRVGIRTHWKRRWIQHGASAPARAEGNTIFFFEIQNHEAKLIDMKGDVLFG